MLCEILQSSYPVLDTILSLLYVSTGAHANDCFAHQTTDWQSCTKHSMLFVRTATNVREGAGQCQLCTQRD